MTDAKLHPDKLDEIIAIATKYDRPWLRVIATNKKMIYELEAVLGKNPDADIREQIDMLQQKKSLPLSERIMATIVMAAIIMILAYIAKNFKF